MSGAKKIGAEELTLLRHTLATVAYRGGKALRGAPDSFANYSSGENGRTSAKILAHVGDLYDRSTFARCAVSTCPKSQVIWRLQTHESKRAAAIIQSAQNHLYLGRHSSNFCVPGIMSFPRVLSRGLWATQTTRSIDRSFDETSRRVAIRRTG